MPRNGSKETINLNTGQNREFYFDRDRRAAAVAEVENNGDVDLTFQAYNAVTNTSEKQTIVLTAGADDLAGTFRIGIGGVLTPAITYDATAGGLVFRTAILAALADATFAAGVLAATGIVTSDISVGAVTYTGASRRTTATIPLYFGGAVKGQNIVLATVNVTSLTGTATVTGVVTETTAGVTPAAFAVVHPDGYSGAVTVKPRGRVTLAYGSAASANNVLGPRFKFTTTAGSGIMTLTTDDATPMAVRM